MESKITIDAKELLNLLDGSQIDKFEITKNTLLVLRVPEVLQLPMVASLCGVVEGVVQKSTGFSIGVLVMHKGVKVEEMDSDELSALKYQVDLLLTHYAIKAQNKGSAN